MLAGFGLRQSIVCTPYYLHKEKSWYKLYFSIAFFCIYISVQNFSLKVELKACLKEYQFTIVNDCELHLHLTLVLSTALNKEHTMTIYVNLQNYLHTRFMKCYRWILFKAMTILGCCNFELYPLGTLKFWLTYLKI